MYLVANDDGQWTIAVRKNTMYTVLIVSWVKKEKAEVLTESLECNLR